MVAAGVNGQKGWYNIKAGGVYGYGSANYISFEEIKQPTFIKPLLNCRQTSPYSADHNGWDLVGSPNVMSIADGEVIAVFSGCNHHTLASKPYSRYDPRGFTYRYCECGGQIGGNYVWVQHADGFVSRYYHLKSTNVRVGQKVKQGDVIAIMGMTGAVTGVHLHLELFQYGKRLNPSLYV